MTRLPEAQHAIIDEAKLRSYLLSDVHPAGRTKAAFLRAFGFRARYRRRLRDALSEHARTAPVVASVDTDFERKYILEGSLAAPDGRKPVIRSVWFIERGADGPRLVTAYPALGVRG